MPKISDLTAATSVGATDVIPIVQSGTTKKLTATTLTGFAKTAAETSASLSVSNYSYPPGDVRRYGAVGDDSTDDTAALQAAITLACSNGGVVELEHGKTYRTTQALTFTASSRRVLFRGNNATIHADHTGHGLDISATNENYGYHTIENLQIAGPNVSYPASSAQLSGTSTGAGIRIGYNNDTTNTARGYNTVLREVESRNFKYGLYMRGSLLGKFYGLICRFNQYGIYVDGANTNANDFFGCSILANRVAGLYSTGATGGSMTEATQNRFFGGIFESNIPYRGDNPSGYSGGYRTARDLTAIASGGSGFGVVLLGSYDWSFYNTYFEDHNVDVWIGGSSDSNDFFSTRHNGGTVRVGGFYFSGSGAINNKVVGSCFYGDSDDVNLITDHLDHEQNQFLDTEGVNFIDAEIVGVPYCRNNQPNQGGGGTPSGQLGLPRQAVVNDVPSGTTPGRINGVGTATATLYAYGYGEMTFDSVVAAAGANTKITTINIGVMRNCMLVLRNYQVTRTVTIAHDGLTGPIRLKGGTDLVLSNYNDMVVFWINSNGHLVQI